MRMHTATAGRRAPQRDLPPQIAEKGFEKLAAIGIGVGESESRRPLSLETSETRRLGDLDSRRMENLHNSGS
jgi:hypothetical protein